ncbi:MAG: hypothetical protein MK085_09565, partial [Phycisphaerales bacterium]|nr:hypothetical protein [Phycisphaerales bacterium]
IFNPISGSGQARVQAEGLLPVLEEHGFEPTCLPTQPGPAVEWLPEALEGHDALVVIGGDGAVHMAAPIAADCKVPLMHQPAGTENLFSRDLRGTHRPRTPEEVAAALGDPKIRDIDLAAVRGLDAEGNAYEEEVMVVMASVGIDADIVHDVAEMRTKGISRLTYLRPILRHIPRWTGRLVTARVDGEEVFRDEPGMVIIANSRHYAARLDPAREAKMDDGKLDLILLPARGAIKLSMMAIRCWLGGGHVRRPGCHYRTGESIELAFHEPSLWQVDGDPPVDRKPVYGLRVEVRPGILPVLT